MAKPAWGYPLDRQALKDAFVVAKRLGLVTKGSERDRRPTLEELDRIMAHFGVAQARRPGSVPMQRIIPFAIFSTRRQEEITRILWRDYEGNRVLVRAMKHPGDKAANDTWCELPPEAAAYIDAMPRTQGSNLPVHHGRNQRCVHQGVSGARHRRPAFPRSTSRRRVETVRAGQNDPTGRIRLRASFLVESEAVRTHPPNRR